MHTRSPPAPAGGFYSSDMFRQTVALPSTKSPGRKSGDTGLLGFPDPHGTRDGVPSVSTSLSWQFAEIEIDDDREMV